MRFLIFFLLVTSFARAQDHYLVEEYRPFGSVDRTTGNLQFAFRHWKIKSFAAYERSGSLKGFKVLLKVELEKSENSSQSPNESYIVSFASKEDREIFLTQLRDANRPLEFSFHITSGSPEFKFKTIYLDDVRGYTKSPHKNLIWLNSREEIRSIQSVSFFTATSLRIFLNSSASNDVKSIVIQFNNNQAALEAKRRLEGSLLYHLQIYGPDLSLVENFPLFLASDMIWEISEQSVPALKCVQALSQLEQGRPSLRQILESFLP